MNCRFQTLKFGVLLLVEIAASQDHLDTIEVDSSNKVRELAGVLGWSESASHHKAIAKPNRH